MLLPPCSSCPSWIVCNQDLHDVMCLAHKLSTGVEKYVENLHAGNQCKPSWYSDFMAAGLPDHDFYL